MGETGIPYCDRTWDLTIGCRKRSPGCENCWAIRTVHRLSRRGVKGYPCQIETAGNEWRKAERVNLLEWNLEQPLHWRKPQFIFVNSKSDLFDERVPFAFILRAFNVMAYAKQHRYMILTKEPGRMAEFIDWYCESRDTKYVWPAMFPHVILMVSVEGPDQIDRIDTLLRIPAAMRGVSLEPLLGPIRLGLATPCDRNCQEYSDAECPGTAGMCIMQRSLDWVVIGCEKLLGGKAGRWSPHQHCMREEFWNAARRVLDACREAHVAAWMKQGPGWPPMASGGLPVTDSLSDFPEDCQIQDKPKGLML